MILMWSPFANRMLAVHIDRTIKPDELAGWFPMPANTLLAGNLCVGQFINGITGLTSKDQTPEGFGEEIPVVKTTWAQWKSKYPATVVMQPMVDDPTAPTRPVLPVFPMPSDSDSADSTLIVSFIDSPKPCAIQESAMGSGPANFSAGDASLLFMRDQNGQPRIFNRQVDGDLLPTFHAHQLRNFRME